MAFLDYNKIILHCGLHKTGSSSLQSILRHNRGLLAAHGVHYPEYRGARLADKMNGNHSLLGLQYDESVPFWDFADTRVEMDSDCDTLLLSAENFSRPAILRKILPQLRQTKGKAEVQFVYYLRRYDHLFESSYAESVKVHHSAAPDPMNFQTTFQVALAPVINAFGVDIVTLRSYDQTRQMNRDLVSDFLGQVGLEHVISDIDRGARGDRLNSKLPRACTFLLAQVTCLDSKKRLRQFFADNRETLPQDDHGFFLSPEERLDLNAKLIKTDQAFFDLHGLGDIRAFLNIDKPDEPEDWAPFVPDWEQLSGLLIRAFATDASVDRK